MNYRLLIMAILVSGMPLFLDAKSLPKDPEGSHPPPRNIYDRFNAIENLPSHIADHEKIMSPLFGTQTEIATGASSPSPTNRKPASLSKGQ